MRVNFYQSSYGWRWAIIDKAGVVNCLSLKWFKHKRSAVRHYKKVIQNANRW